MLKLDPLSFLDDYTENKKPTKRDLDPLSFLDDSSESDQSSFRNTSTDSFDNEEDEASDLLSFLDKPEENFYDRFMPKPFKGEKTSPEKSLRKNVLDVYRPEEKTPEELKAMSIEERMQYAQDLKNQRELQSGTGFAKGALSGATFGASEHIPGLKPDEDDLMVGLGEFVGSYLPISKLYNYIGKPLVSFAAKSPIARQGLMALARMTGFGATGATYKAGKEIVQGEVPTIEELAKEGATWMAIDAALQSVGLGIAFQESVSRIAEQEGISAKEVLSKLWDSTKNYVNLKFGRSVKGEILPEDVEVLMDRAKAAEAEGLTKETEIEVIPKEEAVNPQEKISKPVIKTDEQIDSDLVNAKNELSELEKTKGEKATNERSLLIQEINEIELEKYNRAKQVKPKEEISETNEFPTKLLDSPTEGPGRKVTTLPNGTPAVEYTDGPLKGKTQVFPELAPFREVKNEPKFKNGKQIQFPAGTVGDYIKNPEVRQALEEVVDYPVTILEHPKNFIGTYARNEPIFINKKVESMNSKVRAVLHEAVHLLQDKKGRLNHKNLSMPYGERPQEITAHKFHDWAMKKEFEEIAALKKKAFLGIIQSL